MNWNSTLSDQRHAFIFKYGEAVLDRVEETLAPTHFRDGAWYADYGRPRIVARKID